jgi:hypothetical protein
VLRQLQQDLRRWFTDLRDSVASASRGAALGLGAESYVRLGRVRIAVRVDPGGQRVRLSTDGELRTRVLLRAQSLLVERGPTAVRPCPGCVHWIVRRGKRQYCTATCRNAHYWRNLPPEQRERYRRTWYERAGFGWTRGAGRTNPRAPTVPRTVPAVLSCTPTKPNKTHDHRAVRRRRRTAETR